MRRPVLLGMLAAAGLGAVVYFAEAPADEYAWIDDDEACLDRIDVTRGDERLVLVRSNADWIAASVGGIPARPEAVDALRGLLARGPERGEGSEVSVTVGRCDGGKPATFTSSGSDLASQSLAASYWVSAQPPRLDAAAVETVQIADAGEITRYERKGGTFVETLPGDAARPEAWIKAVAAIRPDSVAAGDSFNWSGAKYLVFGLKNGLSVEAQVAEQSLGPARIRFTGQASDGASDAAESRARDIRAIRGVAFEVALPG